MATQKERELMREIMDLAVDVNCSGGEYTISASYIGHVHVFEVRILDKDLCVKNDPYEWAKLSGLNEIWDSAQAIERLDQMLTEVKTYHHAYDRDGIEL